MSKTGWKKVDKENPEWNDIDTMLNESDPVLTDDPEELKKKVRGECRIKENSKFYKVVKKTD